MTGKRRKFVILIVAFSVITFGWITIGTGSEEVPYVSINELKRNGDQFHQNQFRLGGYVENGSISYMDDHLIVEFTLTQEESILPIRYEGLTPDMFKDDAEVIVVGRMEEDIFVADQLMTKCASRYEVDVMAPDSPNLPEI